MSLPPILLTLIWLLTRRMPHWMQVKATGQPISYHADGSVCTDRWCVQARRHW
jgi:hypothetical protein